MIFLICLVFWAGAFLVACDDENPCNKAKELCDDCGDENCNSLVSTCKVLLGRQRDDCCDSIVDSLEDDCD
jgi:hypothetical protein